MREAVKALTIVDGTVLRAVNRMAWAPAAGFGSALRLHLHFSVYDQVPTDWSITPGNASEAKEWKKKTKTEDFYVVDRLYGQDGVDSLAGGDGLADYCSGSTGFDSTDGPPSTCETLVGIP